MRGELTGNLTGSLLPLNRELLAASRDFSATNRDLRFPGRRAGAVRIAAAVLPSRRDFHLIATCSMGGFPQRPTSPTSAPTTMPAFAALQKVTG